MMTRRAMIAMTGLAVMSAAGARPATAGATAEFLPSDFVAGAWLVYRNRFMETDGRIVDARAGGISHSESQGYGMLLAVKAGERKDFQRIWAWTSANLYVREDKLAAWKWDPAATPAVQDLNHATDGDLLIAWALALAALRWTHTAYADEARAITHAIGASLVIDSQIGKVLLPGASGFTGSDQDDGPVVNLSYWVFPAIADLGALSPEFPAKELIQSGLKLARLARFGTSKLPSNWISLKGLGPVPAAAYQAVFGYDAARIPLYIAWFSRDYPDILEIFENAWSNSGATSISVVDLGTDLSVSPMSEPGYKAVAQLVSCSLGSCKGAIQITDFQPTDYYASTVHILSIVALTERYPECLTNHL
jgi:endo-1,4-beta-D-glucanase Y